MLRRRRPLVAATVLIAGLAGLVGVTAVAPGARAATVPDGPPVVWTGTLTQAQFGQLAAAGVDRQEVATAPAGRGKVKVEVILAPRTAAGLIGKGVPLVRKVARARAKATAAAPAVFRKYSGTNGLRAEYEAIAKKYPAITRLETIGKSVQGQPIIALKVTKDATRTKDGARPSTLYVSNQHAREWITPEMNRRLTHHVVEKYATDASIKKLVDTTELWFVPSANPDGYDYTFTGDNRLWRKNLRDNDGDGQITGGDGVDPNRNFPTKWGYDNEGSSDNPASETYRGKSAASEPETQALDGLLERVRFRFLINYHSAAELLLHGVGWQVDTPTPDDALYEAMAGDDAKPAVPDYDPDLAAELYTTNGETDDHASSVRGTLAFTPEMSTCQTASAADPNDAFDPDDCLSVFNFPDSEPLIQAEFEKNLPFALAVAKSAPRPDNPVSVVGRTAPDFVPDTFTTSYGNPQTVSVNAKRSLKNLTLNWSANGGARRTAAVKEWRGGERYGETGNLYYGDYRGQVTGTKAGDEVKVWFTGSGRSSTPFTYSVATAKKARVLVIADEDITGVNPTYPASVTGPKYAKTYQDALSAKGISSAVWNVDTQGAPSALGVLSHFRGVVWYLGDNRLTQDAADQNVQTPIGPLDDAEVADRERDLTIAVRDFLNEGGKLVHTGETAGYYGDTEALGLGGIWYGLNGDPSRQCAVTADFFSDCLLLADDFRQYWLGAYRRTPVADPKTVTGTAAPLTGLSGSFGGPAVTANPLNEAGSFLPTSSVLPVKQFPQFRSAASATYQGIAGGAFDPIEGSWYAGAVHDDNAYTRLTRTIDLTGVTAAQAPRLDLKLSYSTEPGYDNVLLEARTAGGSDWTTLPDTQGRTTTTVPSDCDQGFLLAEHPFLEHYLRLGADACTATGTSGTWNSFTGDSKGWQPETFDLSAFAGKQVEVSLAYVTDGSVGGGGAFVDDTEVTVGGTATQTEGFESGLGAWSVTGPPAGSPPASTVVFARSQTPFAAAVSTPDTVLFGFGLEQLQKPAAAATAIAPLLRQ